MAPDGWGSAASAILSLSTNDADMVSSVRSCVVLTAVDVCEVDAVFLGVCVFILFCAIADVQMTQKRYSMT